MIKMMKIMGGASKPMAIKIEQGRGLRVIRFAYKKRKQQVRNQLRENEIRDKIYDFVGLYILF